MPLVLKPLHDITVQFSFTVCAGGLDLHQETHSCFTYRIFNKNFSCDMFLYLSDMFTLLRKHVKFCINNPDVMLNIK